MNKKLEDNLKRQSVKHRIRINGIEDLFACPDKYGEILLAIQSRASLVSVAAMVGIHPNTLRNWIQRGRSEKEGKYHEFWQDVIGAVGQAVMTAEIELHAQDPGHYLRSGFARTLLGDLYNTKPGTVALDYGLDGTVSPAGMSPSSAYLEEKRDPGIQGEEDEGNSISDAVTLDALAALRDAGIDLNSLVDSRAAKKVPRLPGQAGELQTDTGGPVLDADYEETK